MKYSDLSHTDKSKEVDPTYETGALELAHLTNNCLQSRNKETYGLHEEGNVVSFSAFQEYLDETFPQYALDFNRDFILRMKDLAIDAYLASKQNLNPSKRRNSFELFGFDYMIDEDFRIWLIEVNTNPSLAINNSGMKHILPKMFSDLFSIVLDPVFERMSAEDKENIWESTHFDLLWSRSRGINKRRPVTEGIYPVKELDPRAPRNF